MTGAADSGRAGLRQALASEWTKLRTVRSTVWTLAMIVVSTVALAGFVGITRSLQPDDTILGGSLTGAALGQIAAAALGVLVMSGEYSTGTIRATLTGCPRRVTVLAAKSFVVAAVAFVVALIAAGAAYRVATATLSGQGHATGQPMPALLGVALNLAAVAVLGLAMGTILRHAAGAITAMLAILLLPSLIGRLFGDWQPWVTGASPLAALQKLSQSSDATPDLAGSLGAWPSLWLVCAYSVAALAVAAWRLHARDA
jgi:ABC-2 type transport system permease protein